MKKLYTWHYSGYWGVKVNTEPKILVLMDRTQANLKNIQS